MSPTFARQIKFGLITAKQDKETPSPLRQAQERPNPPPNVERICHTPSYELSAIRPCHPVPVV